MMAEMSRRAAKTQETKEKIMAATDALLRSGGYESVTFRNLAEASEISFGSIQHHYGTKDNLLFVYGCDRFKRYVEEHKDDAMEISAPGNAAQAAFLTEIQRYLTLYAGFCEEVGKDFMLTSSENGRDIFREVLLEDTIRPALERAARNKGLRIRPGKLPMIEEDVIIICRSIVLMWSASGDQWNFSGDLCQVLTRVMRRFMYDMDDRDI